jgi:cobyric acid synthase
MSYMLELMYSMGLRTLYHRFTLSVEHDYLPSKSATINIEVICESSYNYTRFKITASLDEYKEETSCLVDPFSRRDVDLSVEDGIIKACEHVTLKYLQGIFHIQPETLEEAERLKNDQKYNENIRKVREIMEVINEQVVNSSDVKKLCPYLYSKFVFKRR